MISKDNDLVGYFNITPLPLLSLDYKSLILGRLQVRGKSDTWRDLVWVCFAMHVPTYSKFTSIFRNKDGICHEASDIFLSTLSSVMYLTCDNLSLDLLMLGERV